jgi:hypothetical protein
VCHFVPALERKVLNAIRLRSKPAGRSCESDSCEVIDANLGGIARSV